MNQANPHLPAVVQPTKKDLAIAKMANFVTESAHQMSVELDIPAEQVASIAIRRGLNETQVDDMMLARADHEARFSVIGVFLRCGFSTDQIFTAYHVVDQLILPEEDNEYELSEQGPAFLAQEPTSLAEIVANKVAKAPSATSSDKEGSLHLALGRKNRYVFMVALWIDTFDIFEDISNMDDVLNLFGMIIENAKDNMGWTNQSDLEVLTVLYEMAKKAQIFNYDDLLRFLAERRKR